MIPGHGKWAVQQLRLNTPSAGAQLPFLVGELRSYMPSSVAKRKYVI